MVNEFEKIFEKLARQDDPNVVFTNWLDYVIDINLFTTTKRNLDFKGHEQDFYNMFVAWVNIQNEYLKNNPEKQWHDYLGLFYENIIQSKYRAGTRGQFFTPENVCHAMAEITFMLDKDYDGKLINDCACGSGRLLLAGKQFAPNGIFIGNDLDSVACKMAALNFYIHGIRGAIICKNTLTGEFFEAYRINNYLGWGLPVPHIELCNSEDEACNLFGINDDNEDDIVEINNGPGQDDHVIENNDKVVEKVTPTYKPKGTGQTTLM